jgi:hypothetical protein
MAEQTLVCTRRALHGVAELILAGPHSEAEDVLAFFRAGQEQAARG